MVEGEIVMATGQRTVAREGTSETAIFARLIKAERGDLRRDLANF
jgi:hypothetical protein